MVQEINLNNAERQVDKEEEANIHWWFTAMERYMSWCFSDNSGWCYRPARKIDWGAMHCLHSQLYCTRGVKS